MLRTNSCPKNPDEWTNSQNHKKLPKLTQKAIINLSISTLSKDIAFIIKFSAKDTPYPEDFTDGFYQMFKKQYHLHELLQKIDEIIPTHSMVSTVH